MSAIDKLNEGTPTGASLIPFFDGTNSADRRASLNTVAGVVQELLGGVEDYISSYATPVTGDTVSIVPFTAGASCFLLLTPTTTLSTLTLLFPLTDQCQHGQEIIVHTVQAITTLTVNGNGSGKSGAPTTLAAGSFFRMRFDQVNEAWYRIG